MSNGKNRNKIDIDKELKPLYLAGMSFTEISERTGVNNNTIRTVAFRKKWQEEKDRIENIRGGLFHPQNSNKEDVKGCVSENSGFVSEKRNDLKQGGLSVQVLASLIAEAKQSYIANVSKSASKASQLLAGEIDREGISLSQASESFSNFEPVARVANKALGLDRDTDASINVNILSSGTYGEVIDV